MGLLRILSAGVSRLPHLRFGLRVPGPPPPCAVPGGHGTMDRHALRVLGGGDMNRKLAAVALATLALGVLAGCGDQSMKDGQDVPANRIQDLQSVRVYRMPDNFRNVTVGCDGPNAVYVTSAGSDSSTKVASALFVVPNDSYCAGVTRK